MKKLAAFFISLGFVLAACAPATTPVHSPVPVATQTPRPIPTLTATQPPIILPATPTPALKRTPPPLPTIPTFTPTFDARTIVRATLAPKAQCPTIHEDTTINLSNFDDYYPDLLRALNQGAPIHKIIDVFGKKISEHFSFSFTTKIDYETIDVTNDGVPEIILPGHPLDQDRAFIVGCISGEYQTLYSHVYQAKYLRFKFNDANQNGIPEIIIGDEGCSYSGGCSSSLSILEWHQNEFQIIQDDIYAYAYWDDLHVEDINNDNIKEITWRNYKPRLFPVFSIWRRETHIYRWNGLEFVPLPINYSIPQYRFQAVQDADQKVSNGEYEKAFPFYQDAIFSDKLDWWSPEKDAYLLNAAFRQQAGSSITPLPVSTQDPTEYPKLAAYAYYRMVILHTHLGERDAAATQYNSLQEKFPAASPGHPYAEMASAFWEVYQASQNMTDACGAAIEYAAEHAGILTVLGSDYHGAQSHKYIPADVCPFR